MSCQGESGPAEREHLVYWGVVSSRDRHKGHARAEIGVSLPGDRNTGVGFQPDLDGPRLAQYCCVDWTRGHRVRISGQIIRKYQFAMSRSCNPQERTWTNRLASDSDKNALSKHFGGRKKRDQYGKEWFTKT
ncbi:uncharacterized protein EI90DRAFT_3020958 [Cantharellus anzutake]|uniref:uncharacterized protein n=1 Tax=Cantharellus anzutake TaxID=1750568 RepID=UPI00190565B4|nr:uncharacterized protein EI90DRAFT_3020958 [Cantharellus anzutake]KAF8318575.1 hypothetical protein EI90DRAFT_3020958 [Cantharellus anzutake]